MEEVYLGKEKNRIPDSIVRLILLLIIVALIVFFFVGTAYIESTTIDRQEESLTNAIERDIVQCYCLEGVYPPNLEYLEEHYGLIYNKNLFFVDYRPIASNIYPDVTIIRIK